MPESLKEIIARKLKGRRDRKYSPEIRKFALTLQFYSARAYNYVRKSWANLLPHPSTIKHWYSVIDGTAGFTREAFNSIAIRNKHSQVICNIVIDEISIKESLTYEKNRFYGGIDLGTDFDHDNDMAVTATSALVFMAVALNGNFKIPLGYFLIKGLSGKERVNLLTKCLELFNDTGAKVFSITYDGAPVNITMCTTLGANYDYPSEKFQPWFKNPITGDPIYTFWDPFHMVKLVRNTLGGGTILLNKDHKQINWGYIKSLHSLQTEQGLRAGTKLTKKHVNFTNNKMNVKLATQTLSESVYNAFRFLIETKISGFEDSMPTATFGFQFNNIFDLLNCRNKYGKRSNYNVPISVETLDFLQQNALDMEQYIVDLKDAFGTPILQTKRSTVSSARPKPVESAEDCNVQVELFDHDYLNTLWTLTPFVENIVKYIAGFIVHKITKKNHCETCIEQLFVEDNEKKTHSYKTKK
ncbi:hypothetical protein NQ314_002404 [Rhamnusium bicolor]|uniref:Uncharacterized protein n=1 Tax=Rhamnusium bicolor TaxID=1586634 RepID=A0AAV8ZPN9_9CUCU|nr:hypothetical protein NQ314_002404 [Rhamnusium bicolor]